MTIFLKTDAATVADFAASCCQGVVQVEPAYRGCYAKCDKASDAVLMKLSLI